MKAPVYECHLRYEDGLWTARAPAVSGCYGVGHTKRAAIADLKSAIAAMSNTSKRKTVDDVVRLKITKEEVIALRKLSSPPPTDRIDVQIPAELRARLEHASRMPAHEDHGSTFEALVVRALEAGLVGIELSYERHEDEKPITVRLHANLRAWVARGTKTRIKARKKRKGKTNRDPRRMKMKP